MKYKINEDALQPHEWAFIVGDQINDLRNVYDRLRYIIESKEFDFNNNPYALELNGIKNKIHQICTMITP